ncbi:MAG TPA: deoxyuridine 5'-triphosphate nucleotidohydrolase [candidate division Zixibacteria bacterium]|nr:deoxyuridine 5'-triphosphate nucleotidohydrolase [candidate division Zixibacteria bacterium]
MTNKENKSPNDFTAIYMGDFSNIISDAIDFKKQAQVNGFDLSVKEIFSFNGEGAIDFDNSKRQLPEYIPLKLIDEEYWLLEPGAYVIRYNEIVSVPLDALGIIQPRSTLLRIGGTIIGAWWDSGYSGRGQGLLLAQRPIKLYKNARVAQIVFIISRKVQKGYEGTYQNEEK